MPNWTDNSIGYGSIVVNIASGNPTSSAAVINSAVFDDFTLNMPGIVVQRTDQIGKDNGWALVSNALSTAGGPPVTGTGTLQIPTATTTNQLSGTWFSYAFDRSATASTACFVITDVGIPLAKDGYYKVNVSCKLSRTPPTA